MTLIDRHIGSSVLTSTVLVFVVLLALFVFIKFVDVLGDLGRASFGIYDAVRYVILTLPRQGYELFPMAALLGTLLGLSSLAADSELIAMRAAGISTGRIAAAVLKVGLIFVLVALAMGELVAPITEDLAERGRAAALEKSVRQQKDSGLWMRDGADYVHIGEVLPDFSILRVSIYRFDESDRLRTQIYAQRGVHADQQWRLEEVSQSWIEPDGVRTQRRDSVTWSSELAPDMLAVFAVKPESLSLLRLYRYIQHLEQNKQDTARYDLAFWNKLMLPLATGVMVILAIPFVFTQLRSAGVGSRLLVGIMLGLAFFVASRGLGNLGLILGIPPVIGAVLPTLVFLGAALFMLRRVG
ncbi:MAG TPA: LPS export ABC transporter permease LptG [Acidiferrobacterales bacterium]|jgi:lipopolysaccharide export system permease protein